MLLDVNINYLRLNVRVNFSYTYMEHGLYGLKSNRGTSNVLYILQFLTIITHTHIHTFVEDTKLAFPALISSWQKHIPSVATFSPSFPLVLLTHDAISTDAKSTGINHTRLPHDSHARLPFLKREFHRHRRRPYVCVKIDHNVRFSVFERRRAIFLRTPD